MFAEEDPLQSLLETEVHEILSGGGIFYITPQVLRESWAVLTRPNNVGGYQRSSEEATEFVKAASRIFVFLPDTPKIYDCWVSLVQKHEVSGRQVHDAYHVAAAISHELTHILTLDKRDFARYKEVTITNPLNQ